VNKEDAKRMRLPNATGMFSDLYKYMKNDIYRQKKSKTKHGMTDLELEIGETLDLDDDLQQKRISFLNRYFIYQKKVNVNAGEIKKKLLNGSQMIEDEAEEAQTKDFVADVKAVEVESAKPFTAKPSTKLTKPKKLTRKIKLKVQQSSS
jgi:hypothetical protein